MVDALRADLAKQRAKPPSLRIVQREVAAMMASYAVPVPQPSTDPEDNLGSPLQRLSLYRHLRASDRFERASPTPMPAEALALVLSALGAGKPCGALDEGLRLEIPANSPTMARAGALLGRNREALIAEAAAAAEVLAPGTLSLRSLAGERMVSVTSARSATWLARYLDRMGLPTERAA
jgi:hypothetical protein